jgi:hypothetical protein
MSFSTIKTEWPYFIQNVKGQALDQGVWHFINPALDVQPPLTDKPIRPTPQRAGGTANQTIATLSPEHLNTYKALQEDFRFDHAEWTRENNSMIAIHQYFREHITLPNHDAIADTTTVWGTLRKLQTRCQPTNEAKQLELRMQWNRLVILRQKTRIGASLLTM